MSRAMNRVAGQGPIWSGRPEVRLEWRRTSLTRVAIGLVLVAIGIAIAPWAWATGIEHMQTIRGHRYPGLAGALVALSGAALVAGGLFHALWPVFGPRARLRFRLYALSPRFAIVHAPFTGSRSYPLLAGQQITLEDAGESGGLGSVWIQTEAFTGFLESEKPSRQGAPPGLAPRNIRWCRIGFEQIPDAPHVAALMRNAIATLPES